MRSKVTEQGVLLPKQWFPGVDEVEIRQEKGQIVVVPFHPDDPILKLGRDPITVDVQDHFAAGEAYFGVGMGRSIIK